MSLTLGCKEPNKIISELSPGGETLSRNYPLRWHRKWEECVGCFCHEAGTRLWPQSSSDTTDHQLRSSAWTPAGQADQKPDNTSQNYPSAWHLNLSKRGGENAWSPCQQSLVTDLAPWGAFLEVFWIQLARLEMDAEFPRSASGETQSIKKKVNFGLSHLSFAEL